jgi:hypothetical protein
MNTTDTPDIIAQLNSRIADELTAIDREERFRETLDELYSFRDVGGPFAHMQPSAVLEECDPIAFRCGVNDYADSENWVEINGDYYEQDDCERIKEEMQDELESSITDKEQEIEEAHEDDEANDVLDLKAELSDLQADLATLKAHSF